ncbi:MAG: hypothetical protein ICV64_05900 [Thermoleophilia bacterium]|nr:hypothetical protein [Thermoleophilia bacterium]
MRSAADRGCPPVDRSRTRTLLLPVLAALAAAAAAPGAHGSQIVARNAEDVRLHVDGAGRAVVEYVVEGRPRVVVASDAIDALPPASGRPQVRFTLDYSGRSAQSRRRLLGAFANGCRRYDGPALVWLVAACNAPDGSYWALQRWQRLQPMRGIDPWLPRHRAVELHLSHWSGPLPLLEVSPNWTYGGAWQALFGRLTYRGAPVHRPAHLPRGRGNPYIRYFYIDTYNSAYGPGWKRDAAKATHVPNGAFCYSFVPQQPPPGYPTRQFRGPGHGERHRVTVMGPGVTPIVQWEGRGLGPFNPAVDELFNTVFDRFLSGDPVCTRER